MRLSTNNSFYLNIIIFILMFNFHCYAQTFNSGEIINGHDFSGQVKTFDADRDGDLDVLSFPYLYYNNGNGRKQKLIEIVNSKKQYEDIVIMDMDGDNDTDIVVLYRNGDIEILINEINGFIKKAQKKEIDYMPSEYAKLYLFDANSDGIRDIIISGLKGVPIAYIGDKNLQFTYFKQFNDQFSKLNLILELDVNKDGIKELLTYNYARKKGEKNSLSAYSYNGNKYVIIYSLELTTGGINNPKLFDLDKDGDQDLIYTDGYPASIYWIERNKNGGFGKTLTLISDIDLEDFQLGDFDSDGNIDFYYITRKNQFTSINWAKNTGNNVFVKNQKPLLPNIKNSQTFIFEDFDGDKIKDVLFYNDDNEKIRPRYDMILQNKNGQIKEQNNWMTSSKCSGFILTDINSNGTKDIVGYYNNELFYILIDNNGNYSEAKDLAVSSFKIEKIESKDLNNDGKDDIIISSDDRKNGKVGYYKNDGNLQFKQFTMLHEEAERLINFEIIDYDNDGNNDLAVNYWKEDVRGIYIYKNIGNGVYNKNRIIVTETKVNNSFPRLALWDVNQDGVEDIINNESNGSTNWLKYEGNENWTKQPSPFKERFIERIDKANLDGDKKIDCILLYNNKLQWFKYNTQNQWQNKIIPVDFDIDMVSVGDINVDSFDDFVCVAKKYGLDDGFREDIAFSYKYYIISLENDQTGNFVAKTLFPVSNISSIVLDDIDNDGDIDIITSSASWLEGGITVWGNTKK